MQLYTRDNGTVYLKPHEYTGLYPLSDPVINPCSPAVPLVSMDEVVLEREVHVNAFKAKIAGKIVCEETVPSKDMIAELNSMLQRPLRPNVNHCLLGVVISKDDSPAKSGRKLIGKFVTPLVEGKALVRYKDATVEQKDEWVSQISTAVSALHKSGV